MILVLPTNQTAKAVPFCSELLMFAHISTPSYPAAAYH